MKRGGSGRGQGRKPVVEGLIVQPYPFFDAQRMRMLRYNLWCLKDNARVYLAAGDLNRAINQTRLALVTYHTLKRGEACTQ